MTTKTLRAAFAAAVLSAIGASGCSKEPALDPNAPIVVDKTAGPSAIKGTVATPAAGAMGGEIDPQQQRAVEMETRGTGNQPAGNAAGAN
jgi:hypothetical protein